MAPFAQLPQFAVMKPMAAPRQLSCVLQDKRLGVAGPAEVLRSEQDERFLQIWLLAAARVALMLSRICIGPILVPMASEYSYSAEQKGLILSAFAAGYGLTQVVGGLAADRLGGAPILLLGLLGSGFCLAALPSAAEAGVPVICWLLWCMGFVAGPTYPAIQALIARWSTVDLRSYASSLNGAGSSAGSLLALGLTPVLSARLGWRCTSAAFGLVLLMFSSIWLVLGRSAPPAALPRAVAGCRGGFFPPQPAAGRRPAAAGLPLGSGDWLSPGKWVSSMESWARLLLAPQVLVIFVAHSVHNFVRYFLFAWMPFYYDEVLHVSADRRGALMIAPELFATVLGVFVAREARRLQQTGALSTLGVRRCFASLAFAGQGLALLGMSALSTPLAVTCCLTTVQSFSTLQGPGFHANYLDVTTRNSGLVTGLGDSFATFASGCAPLLASWILSKGSGSGPAGSGAAVDQWNSLFVAFASTNLIGLFVYVPFLSTSPVDERRGGALSEKGAEDDA